MSRDFGDDACAARSESSGNTRNGFAVQRYTLLRLTPRLVLHGFSSAGCPVDAGLGVAASFVAPLRPNFWIVASAGAYVTPSSTSPGRTMKTDARIDLMHSTPVRTLNVGVGTRGFSFGGAW